MLKTGPNHSHFHEVDKTNVHSPLLMDVIYYSSKILSKMFIEKLNLPSYSKCLASVIQYRQFHSDYAIFSYVSVSD